jgi:hypothetical protein
MGRTVHRQDGFPPSRAVSGPDLSRGVRAASARCCAYLLLFRLRRTGRTGKDIGAFSRTACAAWFNSSRGLITGTRASARTNTLPASVRAAVLDMKRTSCSGCHQKQRNNRARHLAHDRLRRANRPRGTVFLLRVPAARPAARCPSASAKPTPRRAKPRSSIRPSDAAEHFSRLLTGQEIDAQGPYGNGFPPDRAAR